MKLSRTTVTLALLSLGLGSAPAAEDRKAKVLNDRKVVEEAGDWIYNDLNQAIAEGKRTGKPLLVTLRCIP